MGSARQCRNLSLKNTKKCVEDITKSSPQGRCHAGRKEKVNGGVNGGGNGGGGKGVPLRVTFSLLIMPFQARLFRLCLNLVLHRGVIAFILLLLPAYEWMRWSDYALCLRVFGGERLRNTFFREESGRWC